MIALFRASGHRLLVEAFSSKLGSQTRPLSDVDAWFIHATEASNQATHMPLWQDRAFIHSVAGPASSSSHPSTLSWQGIA